MHQPVIVFDFKEKRVYQAGTGPKRDLTRALSRAAAAQKKSRTTVGAMPSPPKRRRK